MKNLLSHLLRRNTSVLKMEIVKTIYITYLGLLLQCLIQ